MSNDKLSNDIIYLITDSGELIAENLLYDGSQTGLGNNVQDAIDGLNSNLQDTGWVNLTPLKGTWNFLQIRKIGKKVIIRGYASSITWETSGETLAIIPSEYRPTYITSVFANAIGKRIAKVGVNTTDSLFLDWIINLNDGSNHKSDVWLMFNIYYYLD